MSAAATGRIILYAIAYKRMGVEMNKAYDFRTWSMGGVAIVPIVGEIDVVNADQLRDALLAAGSGAAVVVADMTMTTFCDASGLHALAWSFQRLREKGDELYVVCTPFVQRLMAITGDDKRFPLFASLPEALIAGHQRLLQPRYRAA